MSVAHLPNIDYFSTGQATHSRVRQGDWTEGYSERNKYIPLLFVPSILMGLVSWVGGGILLLNDLAMIILTAVLAGLFINELLMFPKRFGIGGIIAFGGGLLWWCYDYHTHWLGYVGTLTGDEMLSTSNIDIVPAWVIGKTACIYTVFMLCMTLGLKFKKFLIISRSAFKTVEPNNTLILFIVVLGIFTLSMIPYFFSEDSFFETISLSITSGYGRAGPRWTVGRTGNVNFNWGGYLTQLIHLGYAGAVLASFHAVIFTKSMTQRLICFAIFGLQVTLAFGTGARGNVVFVCLPLAIIAFLKYNFVAAKLAKRFSIRSYVASLSLLISMLFLIQVQGYFRVEGFTADSFKNVQVADLRGNEMFTTSLPGMATFPDKYPFLDEPFFQGSGAIIALPKTLYWFCINPIPRALWTTKPIDQTWAKYNAITTGRAEDNYEGTTISRGCAGDPYFRWGFLGMIQIAVLYGWVLRNCEVGIRYAAQRPLTLLYLLGFSTFIFRAFRDLNMHDLYPIIYSTIAMSIFCAVMNRLIGSRPIIN